VTLSEMRRLLETRDLRLTKSLGQNFLHDGNQLRRIVSAGEITAADKVLEIGPGLGPLTEILLKQANEVLAVEKDARLVGVLQERFTGEPKLTLLAADALRWLRDEPRDWSDWKLVANLPYSVASPILVELAGADRPPARLVATLQLEVAQRIAAAPGTADFGLLSLLLQLRYEPRGWFKIPASCFFPAPEVDSACVTLVRREPALLTVAESRAFTQLVKLAFSQRRKMMLKLLRTRWPAELLAGLFDAAGIPRDSRAETLSLEQFVRLTRDLP
jgi:16S rRNA (adenine1518-N6/adenine1519-N6)-dimethyltransferase